MARAKKAWHKLVEEAGVSVYLYERTPGSILYRLVRTPGGGRDRQSMGHRDRALAEDQARVLARAIGDLRHAGLTTAITLGQLAAIYQRDQLPLLTIGRQRSVRGMLQLLVAHFGNDYVLDDLSQQAVDAYRRARQSGAIKSGRHRTPRDGVGAGTIRNELHLLASMLSWGQGHRVGGRRLLAHNPLVGVTIPTEKNARRPVANEARYQALLAVADRAEPTGRFRCVLSLARFTGRRIRAICELRVSDVLLTRDALRAALAAYGMDLAFADAWPHGAIRWSAATDKLGFEAITPLGADARAALDLYLRTRSALGDVPLFPRRTDDARPVGKEIAGYWLRRAEKLAKLEHLDRGGYHAFRRAWASERRHLPAQDVAAAAGWRSLQVMRSAYMHADAATVYSVVESRPVVPTPASPDSEVVPPQQVMK